MEALMGGLGDAGGMITLVAAAGLEDDTHDVTILTANQLEDGSPQPLEETPVAAEPLGPRSRTPHCLVCNAKLGVSARGAIEVFSDKAKTSQRQQDVAGVLGGIVRQELRPGLVHSSILCKKCFKLIDDIDATEAQLVTMKQVVTNKYMRTLAVVKETVVEEGVEGVVDDDPLTGPALSNDDKDFKLWGRGTARRGRRGTRPRGRPPSVKVEVKQEEAVEVITGLVNTDQVEPFRPQSILGPDGTDELVGAQLGDDGTLGAQLVEETTLGAQLGEEGALVENGAPQEMLMVEDEMLDDSMVDAVEDVMEVDGLDLDDAEGCVQMSGLTMHSLGGHDLGVGEAQEVAEDGTVAEEAAVVADDGTVVAEEGLERYKCRFCSLKMALLVDIQKHMREAHPERLYECEVCQQRLATKGQLVKHLEEHIASGEKPYSCTLCPRRYALPRQLKEHLRHHMNKTFACTHCPKRFRSEPALQEHFNLHTGNRPYSCDQCTKKFTSKHVLKTHMKTHGVRHRPHQCATCGKNFLTAHHLQDHLNVHEGKKNFICESCGKAFATQRSLDLHAITHSGVKNFACSICNKLFARKGEVEDHERTHTGEKPFQCEICGSTFSQRSNLQSHKRTTHFQEKRYQCSQCNKAFKRKRLLVYHVMSIHTGERPYKCEQCNAGFVYPEHYKKHLRIHTGEKPFKCDICGKTFNSRDNRNAHKFIHSDKKPYECLLCGAGFMRKPMLGSHLQQHGHTENLEAYIKLNPPTVVAADNMDGVASPSGAVRPMKLDEEQSLEQSLDAPVQLVRGGVRDEAVEVVSRPVHIIEADDIPRYIIHTTGAGERTEEGVGHFFASLQGQVVEVRAEDIERYTDLTSEQMNQVAQVAAQVVAGQSNSGLQQVAVSGDLRPFHIQLEPGREITLQTQASAPRDVATTIGVQAGTSARDAALPAPAPPGTTVLVSSRPLPLQYEANTLPQSTLRKVLTDREEIRTISVQNLSDGRAVRGWQQQNVNTSTNSFIGN